MFIAEKMVYMFSRNTLKCNTSTILNFQEAKEKDSR